jgi:hypothetical protein
MERKLTKAERQRIYRERKKEEDPDYLKKQAEKKRALRLTKNPDLKPRNSKYNTPNTHYIKVEDVEKPKSVKIDFKKDCITLINDIIDPDTDEKTLVNYINKLRRLHKGIYNTDLNCLDLSWLEDIDKVSGFIMENYKALNTKKNYITAITSITRRKGMPITAEYQEVLMNLAEGVKKEIKKNKKSDKEKKEWKSIEDIKSDVEHTEGSSEEKTVVALYSFNPPRRGEDYYNMRIYSRGRKTDKHNYLVLKKGVPDHFEFNSYKTDKTYGSVKVEINDELKNILQEFIGDRKSGSLFRKMEQSTYSNFVKESFNLLTGSDININMIRHIFITEFLSGNPSIEEKEEMAKKMGHNLSTQNEYSKHK